jgi:hypothetical protein
METDISLTGKYTTARIAQNLSLEKTILHATVEQFIKATQRCLFEAMRIPLRSPKQSYHSDLRPENLIIYNLRLTSHCDLHIGEVFEVTFAKIWVDSPTCLFLAHKTYVGKLQGKPEIPTLSKDCSGQLETLWNFENNEQKQQIGLCLGYDTIPAELQVKPPKCLLLACKTYVGKLQRKPEILTLSKDCSGQLETLWNSENNDQQRQILLWLGYGRWVAAKQFLCHDPARPPGRVPITARDGYG